MILDLHSRRVIGRTVSYRIKRDMAIRALKMAIRCPAGDAWIAERGPAITAARLHIPQRPRPPILFPRLPKDPEGARVQGVDERQKQLL